VTATTGGAPVVTLREGVLFRELQGEAVIIDLQTGYLYGLDEVSFRFWRTLQEEGDLDVACTHLLAQFDGVDEATLRRDLAVFIGQLEDAGLLSGPAPAPSV
jgi:hypothetical protein